VGLIIRCRAGSDGYRLTSISASRSIIRSSLLKSKIRTVTSPISENIELCKMPVRINHFIFITGLLI
jgi:hypothetical protein